MIALAIILAAIISQFTLELGDLLQQPIQAGLNIDETYDATSDSYDVRIVWASEGTVERIHAVEPDGSQTPEMTDVGEELQVNNMDSGDTIRIIGTLDTGESGVIQEYEVG